jgi:hypothetical protein
MKRGSGLVPLGTTRRTMRHLGGPLTIGVTLVLGILGGPACVGAQQPARVPRIGVVFAGAPSTSSHSAAAFEQGMREHGWRENQDIVIERRFGEARVERMAEIAAELVRLNVDVIVASTDAGIASVKQRTHTIPIVMVNSTDPVETGFVAPGTPRRERDRSQRPVHRAQREDAGAPEGGGPPAYPGGAHLESRHSGRRARPQTDRGCLPIAESAAPIH